MSFEDGDDQMYFSDDDEVCPDYNVAISRSNTATTTSSGGSGGSSNVSGSGSSGGGYWSPPPRPLPPLRFSPSRPSALSPASPSSCFTQSTATTQPLRTPRRTERFVYTYRMVAAGVPLTFLISVEPTNGRPPGQGSGTYTFRLSLKMGDVERPIGGPPVVLRLSDSASVDPRRLDFVVFLFPGKKGTTSPASHPAASAAASSPSASTCNLPPPTGSAGTESLFSLRVWLRANGVEHRLFGQDELWLGKGRDDIEFTSAIEGVALARLRPDSIEPNAQVYEGAAGRARVRFILKWHHLGERRYQLSVEYEAGGIGATLSEASDDSLQLTLTDDPCKLHFLIYSVPVRSVPKGASHRLRLWLKTPAAASGPPDDVYHYHYQRLWKSDIFKVGAGLDFQGALGPKVVMGLPAGGGVPQTIVSIVREPPDPPPLQPEREPQTVMVLGYQRETKMLLGM